MITAAEMPFWLSHQSIRHSKLCTTRDTNVKTMQTRNQFNTNSIQHHETNNKNQSPITNQSITSRHPNNMHIMSRRESRFFEEMNCGVRRLIYNSPSYMFSYFHIFIFSYFHIFIFSYIFIFSSLHLFCRSHHSLTLYGHIPIMSRHMINFD